MLSDIFDIIKKVVPDQGQADKLKADIQLSYDKALTSGIEANKAIVLAEIQSDSWLQRSWRPIAALIVFIAIFVRFPLYHLSKLIVAYYDLNIYLPELADLPSDFYLMATAFISIYTHGRSIEKRMRK